MGHELAISGAGGFEFLGAFVLVVGDLRPEDLGTRRYLGGVVCIARRCDLARCGRGLGLPMIAGLRDAVLDYPSGWADRSLMIQVHANADSGEDVRRAKELGASGIGLCRLEHVLAAGGGTA